MEPNDSEVIHTAVSLAEGIEGWMHRTELAWLARAARKHSIIVEVGSWKGRSTKAIGYATRGKVYAVDNWKGASDPNDATSVEVLAVGSDAIHETFRRNLWQEIGEGRLTTVRADSDAAPERLKALLAGVRPDMIFLDGDHAYEAVSRDLRAYMPLLVPGGLLCGHDYAPIFPGVQRAVQEIVGKFTLPVGSIWAAVSHSVTLPG